MKYFLCYLFAFIFSFSACQNNSKTEYYFEGRSEDFPIGQWYADDNRYPHWIMFDSVSNYYRWSFDEEKPIVPNAKYRLEDSIIYFRYPEREGNFGQEGYNEALIIDFISPDSFRLLPIDGEITVYEYVRDTFEKPQYEDIYFFFLSKDEVDSLDAIGNKNVRQQYVKSLQNMKDISMEMEYSLANTNHLHPRFIYTRDSVRYDKFDFGGFGIIYYRNDSTYVRSGIPTKEKILQEAKSFFPYL